MSDLNKLAAQMKNDWDRRVSHDYRFWMSDGHRSDAVMWESGKRDLDLIVQGIMDTKSKVVLEVGCGVGRIINSAHAAFGKAIGLDVSEKAIAKARELLGNRESLELIQGDGLSLAPLPAGSIDVAYSFAALTSMPTDIIANYLREFHRVLKPTGTLRLQMYLGKEHRVRANDTLHVRCYDPQNFENAVKAAGFDIEWKRELVLPIQVSAKEFGIEAMIVSLVRSNRAPAELGEIARLLLPRGEMAETEVCDSETIYDPALEHWMAVNYARELVESGDIARAREAVDYATQVSKNASIDVSDILQRIVTQVERAEAAATGGFWNSNLAIVSRRGWNIPAANSGKSSANVEFKQVNDGPIALVQGQCLDHPEKPVAAADTWAKRVLNEERIKQAAQLVVFGFGAGYHVEALQRATDKKISVIEPMPEVMRGAMTARDLSTCLEKLEHLSVGSQRELHFLDESSELIVRPQSQTISPDYCAQVKAQFFGTRGVSTLRPMTAILGPLSGGTLPIAGYTARALAMGRQRIRTWDVSGFASAVPEFEKFVFDKQRQAALQGSYIEMVSQVLLESANEKPIDILLCMAQAPVSGRVLTELRNRGVITVLWFMEDYLRFTYWKDVAKYYDFVFTIQRGDCIDKIKAAGAGEVHYLPMACDPAIHRPLMLNEADRARWGSPISFVGAGYHNRQQTFASLADMPFKIWGTEWPGCRPFDRLVQEEGRRLTPDEYIKIFNATDININLHSSSERDGVDPFGDFINPRTFELAAANAFQLVDERTHLAEMFEPGEEIVTFNSPYDLKEKIDYYLAHPEERCKIAERARQRVLREHTYAHRMKQMLSTIYSSRFEMLKRREAESPWHRMIARAKPHSELHERCVQAHQRGEEPKLDGLVADIVTGKGKLSETEQKLLFLFHVRKQIIRMTSEELGLNK